MSPNSISYQYYSKIPYKLYPYELCHIFLLSTRKADSVSLARRTFCFQVFHLPIAQRENITLCRIEHGLKIPFKCKA